MEKNNKVKETVKTVLFAVAVGAIAGAAGYLIRYKGWF